MNKIIFKVEGMMCMGCENRIKNSLLNVDGVRHVDASYLNKTVEISITEEANIDILKNAIQDLGFEILDVIGE